jgi:hypothetical protein
MENNKSQTIFLITFYYIINLNKHIQCQCRKIAINF